MSLADKIIEIAKNTPKVHRAGRISVINPNSNWINWANWATQAQSITLYDCLKYDDTKDVENFNQMFISYTGTSIKEIDTSNGKNFYQMFANTPNLSTIPPLNVSGGENFESMFYNSGITTLPRLDTANGKNFRYMFKNDIKLKRIEGINISNVDNSNDIIQMFEMAYRLEEIKFEGVIPVTIEFNGCTNITGECVVDIVKHLKIFKPSDEEYQKHKISFYTSGIWDRATIPIDYNGKSLSVREYVDEIGWLRNY